MSLEAYIAERGDLQEEARKRDARDADLRAWLWARTDEQRLLAYDRWVRGELAARLDWTWAGSAKVKRIEQCQLQLATMLKHLFERGWRLDGKPLAGLVTAALDEVGKAQREGRVKDFWPFFKAVITRYVGTHAEEIREQAMGIGAHVSQIFAAAQRHTSIPELVAQRHQERLTDRLARQRRLAAQKATEASQQRLF